MTILSLPKDRKWTMPDSPANKARKRPRTHPEINEYRRRTLVEGALRSLAARGVAGTTVATISKEAGASRGLLGHYYETKDDVMVASLQHLFNRVAGLVRDHVGNVQGGAKEKLLAVPAAMFSAPAFTQLHRTAFLALWHETRFNEKVRKANRKLYRDYMLRMETMVRAAAAELGTKVDPRNVALSYIALSDGLWLGMSIHDDMLTGAQAVAMCQDHLKRELSMV